MNMMKYNKTKNQIFLTVTNISFCIFKFFKWNATSSFHQIKHIKDYFDLLGAIYSNNINICIMMKKSIWERIFGRKSKEEPIEIKRHNTIHRKTISDNAKKTLGSGDLKKAVELPADGKYIYIYICIHLYNFGDHMQQSYGYLE